MKKRSEAELPFDKVWGYLDREAAILMLLVDGTGTILRANRYARELTGLPLVGGSLGELLIVSSQQADLSRWLDPSEEPRLMNVKTRDTLTQTLYVSSFPAGGDLLLLGQVDPQEQDRLRQEFLDLNAELAAMERELSLANAELARLDSLKSRFLGMASHDLRRPIGLILNRAELLLEDQAVCSSAGACHTIRGIIAAAGSMARLVDDFLDVSTIESGRLNLDIQLVRQQELVAAAWELAQPAAGARAVTLSASLDPAAARLRVDGPKLEQVLANLFSNAIQHSPEGACVIVASRVTAEGIRFWVEDSGDGFPAEARRRLAEGMVCDVASRRGGEGGHGFGLVIVRSIVEAHGGRCFVESRAAGAGTVSGFLLPNDCLAGAAEPEYS